MLNLLHKNCKLGGYIRGQMPKDANVICEGSLSEIHVIQGVGVKLWPCHLPAMEINFYVS